MAARTLYSNISGVSDVLSIDLAEGYKSFTRSCTIECNSTTLDIGSPITIDAGYTDSHGVVFTGIVKKISKSSPENLTTLTCFDTLVKANDFFLAADNPEKPFTWENIDAATLVSELLEYADITFTGTPTNFIFTEPSFNLVSISDAINQINGIIVYHIWCESDGTIRFEDRRPYIMAGDTPTHTFVTGSSGNIIATDYMRSDDDLRNKVLVYGKHPISATASAVSPYLPVDFYKTAVIASPLITKLDMAQDTADFNLELYNRLTKTVNCEALGDHTLHVNAIVTITEANTGVSGDWFVHNIGHSWSESGYTMKMMLRS